MSDEGNVIVAFNDLYLGRNARLAKGLARNSLRTHLMDEWNSFTSSDLANEVAMLDMYTRPAKWLIDDHISAHV